MPVLTNSKLWLGAFDLSADMNKLSIGYTVPMLNDTVFGDTTGSNAPGIPRMRFGHGGIYRAGVGSPDERFSTAFGVADTIMTVCPTSGAEGDYADIARVLTAEYEPIRGEVGTELMFAVSGEVSGGFAHGRVLHFATRTATSTTTGVQVGAVASGQSMYATLHVITVAGTNPTLDVKVQSDDNSGFTTPTDRITFSQAVAATSQWGSVAGAVTDDYWRLSYTIGGTGSPSFLFVVAIGIR
jgi:hypothetical protein